MPHDYEWGLFFHLLGVFALGTVPMLLLIGAASSFGSDAFRRRFTRAAAVLVVLLGLAGLPAAFRLLTLG